MPGIFKRGRCSGCGKGSKVDEKNIRKPVCACGAAVILGDNWNIWYSQDGRKVEKSIGANLKAARAALGKVEMNQVERRGNLNRRQVTSWKDGKEKFISWAERSVRPNTLDIWQRSIKYAEEIMAPQTLDDITPTSMELFVETLSHRGLGPATINGHITCLKRMFAKAEEWGLVEINGIRNVSREAAPDPIERSLTDDELERLLSALNESTRPFVKAIVLTALNTGLRISDIVSLRRDEIDFREMVIRKAIQKKKKNRKLSVPLTEELAIELRAFIKKHPAHITGFLFPSRNGRTHISTTGDYGWEQVREKAKIKDFRFHDLRHSFATMFLAKVGTEGGNGSAMRLLQELLGHSNSVMTQRYAHILQGAKKEAMEVFGKAMRK